MSTVTVTLPDGTPLEVERGSTVEDVAYEIGPGLGDDTVAGVVDGELVDKHAPLTADVELEIVTESSAEYLDVLRHSAAHVFAQALQRLYPDAKLKPIITIIIIIVPIQFNSIQFNAMQLNSTYILNSSSN